jgi:hypothetical protein
MVEFVRDSRVSESDVRDFSISKYKHARRVY